MRYNWIWQTLIVGIIAASCSTTKEVPERALITHNNSEKHYSMRSVGESTIDYKYERPKSPEEIAFEKNKEQSYHLIDSISERDIMNKKGDAILSQLRNLPYDSLQKLEKTKSELFFKNLDRNKVVQKTNAYNTFIAEQAYELLDEKEKNKFEKDIKLLHIFYKEAYSGNKVSDNGIFTPASRALYLQVINKFKNRNVTEDNKEEFFKDQFITFYQAMMQQRMYATMELEKEQATMNKTWYEQADRRNELRRMVEIDFPILIKKHYSIIHPDFKK